MRVRFFQPCDEAETERYLALLRRMDAFWSEFKLSEARRALAGPLSHAQRARIAAAMTASVARVHDGLVADVFPSQDGESVAVLPSEDAALGPLVRALFARAPARLAGGFARHRWPQRAPDVFAGVQAETGADLSQAVVRAGFSRGHLLDVVVYSHEFGSSADDRALDAANLAVARLLGDEKFDDWVAAVDVAPAPRPSSLRVLSVSDSGRPEHARFPLSDLSNVVDRAVAGLRAGLPGDPYHAFCERAEWTLFELDPAPGACSPAQDDLAFCVTMLPEMTKCFLQHMRFSSCRFSNHGERFAYLKVHGGGATSEERMQLRLDLEEALNYALVPGRVGCVVGAGLGLDHVYVNVALQNLDVGLDAVRRTARKLCAPPSAWIHFFDSEWRNEWVGVWDETKAPPVL